MLQSMGSQRVRRDVVTEQQQDGGTADCPGKGMLSFGNSNVTFKKIKAGLQWWLRI